MGKCHIPNVPVREEKGTRGKQEGKVRKHERVLLFCPAELPQLWHSSEDLEEDGERPRNFHPVRGVPLEVAFGIEDLRLIIEDVAKGQAGKGAEDCPTAFPRERAVTLGTDVHANDGGVESYGAKKEVILEKIVVKGEVDVAEQEVGIAGQEHP